MNPLALYICETRSDDGGGGGGGGMGGMEEILGYLLDIPYC